MYFFPGGPALSRQLWWRSGAGSPPQLPTQLVGDWLRQRAGHGLRQREGAVAEEDPPRQRPARRRPQHGEGARGESRRA
ncbi:hypothetical protein ACFFX0_16105 [Citricoccus parietis]|uniref:Uncharacterized protein n=1 Tax=Citricoccus parietis TaxID=592307 RepID=A0ABV5G132_9MICC